MSVWQRFEARVLLILLFSRTCVAGKSASATQSIYKSDDWNTMKPCAQSCFLDGRACAYDVAGAVVGCVTGCNRDMSRNDCYCRGDTMPIINSFLLDCVKSRCKAGDSKIDMALATTLYKAYCNGLEYTAVKETPTSTAVVSKTSVDSEPSTTLATQTSILTPDALSSTLGTASTNPIPSRPQQPYT